MHSTSPRQSKKQVRKKPDICHHNPFPSTRPKTKQMASSHQTGPILQHWNDVPPDFTPSASSSRSATPGTGSRTPSHPAPAYPVSSLLNTKYNNTSTLSLAVNLGSRAGSRSNSVAGYRGGDAPTDQTARYIRDQAAYDSVPTPPPNTTDNNSDLPALLARLLALPTTMSAAEFGLARERLLLQGQQDPGEEQMGELVWVVREVVEGRQDGATWGRGMIVGFLKEWVARGVDVDVRWLGTLRRVIESLGEEGEGEGEG
jgi:hypothetical protein